MSSPHQSPSDCSTAFSVVVSVADVAVGFTPVMSLGTLGGLGLTISYLWTGSPPRGGDSSAWALLLVFAGYGLAGSLVGTGVGMVLRVGVAPL
jgi:hypothetical protein